MTGHWDYSAPRAERHAGVGVVADELEISEPTLCLTASGPDTLKRIVSTTLSAIIDLLPPMDMVLANDSPCRDLLTEVRQSITEVSGTPAR